MTKNALSTVIVACAVLTIGCAQKQDSSPSASVTASQSGEKASQAAAETVPAGASPADSVELIDADWPQIEALVKEQRGKIVVLDLWSTACEPCMDEFPNLLKLQGKYPDDVAGISFDLDYAGIPSKPQAGYRERVLKFLNGQNKSTVRHRMSTVAADEIFAQISLDSIPAIFVYDREGQLVKKFNGLMGPKEELSYEKHVIPFVEQLVTASQAQPAGSSN